MVLKVKNNILYFDDHFFDDEGMFREDNFRKFMKQYTQFVDQITKDFLVKYKTNE